MFEKVVNLIIYLALVIIGSVVLYVARKSKLGVKIGLLTFLVLITGVTAFGYTFLNNKSMEPAPAEAAAETCYWVGDTNPAVWNDANHWADATGGVGGTCDGGVVPGADDTVIFDGGNTNSATVDVAISLVALNISSGYTGTVTLSPTAGQNLTLTGDLTLAQGTFDANGRDVSCVNVTASGALTRTLDYGEGTWTVSGNWNSSGTNQTEQPRTSTVDLTESGSVVTKDNYGTPFDFYTLKCAHDTKTTTILSSINTNNLFVYSGGTLAGSIASYVVRMYKSDGDPLTNTGATITASILYRSSSDLTIAGHTFSGNVDFSSFTNYVTYTLSSNLTVGETLTIWPYSSAKIVTLSSDIYDIQCKGLKLGWAYNGDPGAINFGSGTHTIGSNGIARNSVGILNTINFGTSNTSIGGNIDFTGITVTPGTSTVTMNAGDTGNTITSASQHFNNLAFSNAAGGWSFVDAALVDGNFTVVTSETAGNGVNLNNQTVGVGRDVRIDAGKLTAGSSAITVGGSWTVNGGTFEKGTSTVTMSATASSLDFDGSNDNVNLGNITELNSTANFTISAWMKQDVVPSTDYLFLRNGGASSLIGILPYNTNVLFVYIKNPDNTYGQLSSYSNYITAGRWHHISVVYDGAGATNADRLKLYIDGIYVAFTGFAGTIPSTTPNIPAINATIGHSSNSFDGGIQDFRIYNASLSAPNITTLYQTGTYTTGMVHRYLLREGSGIVATDTGSNVMNGSISGVTWSLTGNTIKSNGQAFNNITFNGTGGGWTLNDALVASGDFTLTAGTFNASTFNVTCVNMTANGSATRVLQYGTGNTWTVSGNWDSSGTNQTETVGTSTVDLTGTGSVISKGTTAGDFYNLKCAHDTKTTTGGASENYVLSLLYVYSGGTLSGINTFILSNFTGDGLVNTGATFTGSGAIRYRPSANITVAGYNFGTWQVQYDGMTNNVTITLSSSVATTSNISTMNYTSGKTATLDTGGFNLSCANLYAGWNTLFGGIIILRGGSHTVTGDLKRNGGTDATNAIDFGTGTISVGGNTDFTGITVTPGTGAQTVTMNTGTTGKTITSVGAHFNNLIFNNATGGWAFQDQAYIDGNLTVTNSEIVGNGVNFNNQAVDINGNVQIDGGKLSTGSSSTNVGGNWTRNAGTVNTTGSTVTFDGGGAQAITSGGQSFNDLVITNASAAGTTFADGAAVAGTFTDITPSSKVIFNDGDTYDFNAINLNGADAATRINLLSSNPGTQWLLNITDAAPSALFVSVQDSDASGGSQIDATTGGLNLGNNLNWLFGVATVVVSPSSATLDQVATQAFSATAYDSGGIVIPGTVFAWSVINGGGTIDGSGLFTAGTTAGSYAGTVKATASGINGLATVTVNELPITPAILGVGGEIELKKTPILPTETAPETTKKKEDITLNDFQFYVALESGNLPLDITDEKNIETIINSNILVEISADLFAKKVNVITISNSGSTYLMNLLTDKNKYQAVIPMPAVKGDFELRILVVYEDGTIKEIKKTITVDPQGYVYTQSSNYFGLGKKQEVRMADAKVTLYKVSGGESSVWDSGGKEPNPAVTNQSGEYAFWVPNGDYYMQIEKAGYKTIKTANFTVNNSLVVKNIEIEPRVKPWIWLIVISVILAAGAYLLIRRRKKLKPIRGNK